jgi:hypothetical protein
VHEITVERQFGATDQSRETVDGQLLRTGARDDIDVRSHGILEAFARAERGDRGGGYTG